LGRPRSFNTCSSCGAPKKDKTTFYCNTRDILNFRTETINL
jgi:hypothetical protein